MTTAAASSSPDLDEATNRLVRAVDALPDAAHAAPSGLPGWTRAHVVAHLALHAQALAAALVELAEGAAESALHPSDEARDAAIDALAAAGPGEARAALLQGCGELREVLGGPGDRAPAGRLTRTPGSREGFAADRARFVRWCEVEVHHADLDLGYGPDDWPTPFAAAVVDSLRARAAATTLLATDLGRTWYAEGDHRTVAGPVAALAWWLTGRGGGVPLTCNSGDLPPIEEW